MSDKKEKVIKLNKANVDLSAVNNLPEDVEEDTKPTKRSSKKVEQPVEEEIEEELYEEPQVYDDPIEHEKRVAKLRAYGSSRLAKHLTDFNFDIGYLKSQSIEQLNSMENQITYRLGLKTGEAMASSTLLSGIGFVEPIVHDTTSFKIKGLAYHLQTLDDFHDVVAELNLKYMSSAYISPEKRLGMILIQGALNIHQINTSINVLKEDETKKVPQSVINKHKDL